MTWTHWSDDDPPFVVMVGRVRGEFCTSLRQHARVRVNTLTPTSMNSLSSLKPSSGRDESYPQFRSPLLPVIAAVSEQTKTVLAASSQASSNETPM